MTFKSFLKECNEKEVLKMLSIYIVSSWVLIQVLAVTWDPLGLPKVSVTYLILLLLIGLPFYIYYIWHQKLASLEAEKPVRISKKGKPKKSGFYKMYFTSLFVTAGICLVAAAFIVENNFFKTTELRASVSTDKIAILKFGNNTGNPDNDIIGKMTSDWIMHGITQYQLGQVVSPEILNDYVGILTSAQNEADDKQVLNRYFKPAKVITGNYYLNKDELLFQCSIVDGNYDKTFISFQPIKCDKNNPLACIESLKQKVLGYLKTEDNPELNLEETPPKYEAYQYFIDAEATFGDDENYIDLLNKAIAADEDYFEPKVMRVAYYYNRGEFRIADSLKNDIVPNSRSGNRQTNLLETYNALLEGNNRSIYKHTLYEYNFAPFHILTNAGAMVVTLQYVNKPEEVDSIYKAVSMEGMNLESCKQCQYRIYTQALANIELEKYQDALKVLKPLTDILEDAYLQRPMVTLYVRSGKYAELESQLSKLEITNSPIYMQQMYLHTGKEFLLLNKNDKAGEYFDKVISANPEDFETSVVAEAYYFKKDFKPAQRIFEKLRESNPEDFTVLSRLAVCYEMNSNRVLAASTLEKLNSMRGAYQFGSIDYALAQYYAATANKSKSLEHLLRSIADGNLYTPSSFQNDPHFISYRNDPSFENIMTYWH